jgi:hypothetical protein
LQYRWKRDVIIWLELANLRLTPIMGHLLDEDGNSMMGIPQDKLDETLAQAAEEIPKSVVAMYQFWWASQRYVSKLH